MFVMIRLEQEGYIAFQFVHILFTVIVFGYMLRNLLDAAFATRK